MSNATPNSVASSISRRWRAPQPTTRPGASPGNGKPRPSRALRSTVAVRRLVALPLLQPRERSLLLVAQSESISSPFSTAGGAGLASLAMAWQLGREPRVGRPASRTRPQSPRAQFCRRPSQRGSVLRPFPRQTTRGSPLQALSSPTASAPARDSLRSSPRPERPIPEIGIRLALRWLRQRQTRKDRRRD